MTVRLAVGAISADAYRLASTLLHRLLRGETSASHTTLAGSTPILQTRRKASLLRFTHMLSSAAEQSGRSQIGLELACMDGDNGYSIFGDLFRYAPTVGDALESMCRYFPAVQTGTTVQLRQSHGVAHLVYNVQDPLVGDRPQDAAYTLGKLHRSLARSAGSTWALEHVTLAVPAPQQQEPYRRFFRAPVSFGAATTALHFPAHWLDRPIATADRERYDRFCAHLERLMPEQADDDLLEDALRSWMVRAAHRGDATLERAAADFGVTPRTLQRRLKAQGTTFQAMLTRVRMEEAQRMLAESRLSVTDIAGQLGFSETSAFTRAFRSFTRQSPSAFRRAAHSLS